jgi:hypothetical protein
MNLKRFLLAVVCLAVIFSCKRSVKSSLPEVKGLTCVGSHYFQPVVGTTSIKIPNGNFEKNENGWPVNGWSIPNGMNIAKTVAALTELNQRIPKPAEIARSMNITLGEYDYIFSRIKEQQIASPWSSPLPELPKISLISDKTAPEGKSYLHIEGSRSSLLRSPDFDLKPEKPHFLSLWVRSNAEAGGGPWFWFDIGLDAISVGYHGLPDTHGEWKRVGLYFRPPAIVQKAHWTMHFDKPDTCFIDIDDVQLRTATEEEFSEAYNDWRKTMPANEIAPGQEDGKYLAATIAKLEGKLGIPGKPFLIWGVGSSWTNFQGDLETWRQIIRKRFPDSPEIIYKNRVGSGCPFDYARGWVHTQVLAEQPDLIFCYTNGSPEALDLMLKDIRQHSTADIIIPSLHFFENGKLIPEEINDPVYDKIRDICQKYNTQFVDNRRELASWLLMKNEPVTHLLMDFVHQNELGKLLINENISAHFVKNSKPAYNPDDLEKQWFVPEAYKSGDKHFTFSDGWELRNNELISYKPGNNIMVQFDGNRIDLIGLKTSKGGKLQIKIDGKPANQLPAYFISFIEPAITNVNHDGSFPRNSGGNHDTGPHAVWLGTNVIPQSWTIKMIDNDGNYELEGKATGFDGKGNNRKMFVSKSGQIVIDPAIWRHPESNIKGDNWTFEVYICAIDTVNFRSSEIKTEAFSIPLVQNLTNGPHTLEVINGGTGEVSVRSFYVFTPMIK